METANISNFKKILASVQTGTSEAYEIEFKELSDALKKIEKKDVSLMQKISGGEYGEYKYEELRDFLWGETTMPVSVPTAYLSPDILTMIWGSSRVQPGIPEVNIDKLLDELNQKNQMIQALSTTLKVSDKLFARLLNRLSIGFVLFFLLTVLVCYLVFS